MTDPRIAEIQARVDAVQAITPGPWEHETSDTYGNLVWFVDVVPDPETNGETPMQVQEFIAHHIPMTATAEFVAASIEDIPFLLSRLAEYDRLLAEHRAEFEASIARLRVSIDDPINTFSGREYDIRLLHGHEGAVYAISRLQDSFAALSVSPEPKEENRG